ncbi:hypothetical protein NHX12_003269, partial [Muraenolepis orangiensis]
MCADCVNVARQEVLNFGAMDSQTKQDCHRCVCEKVLCGVVLPPRQGNHCCLEAVRAHVNNVERRSATLQHESRMARLRWVRRERSLLAQVASLQGEAQLAALKYQQNLHRYMLNIHSIADQVIGIYKGDKRISGEAEPEEQDEAKSKGIWCQLLDMFLQEGLLDE